MAKAIPVTKASPEAAAPAAGEEKLMAPAAAKPEQGDPAELEALAADALAAGAMNAVVVGNAVRVDH